MTVARRLVVRGRVQGVNYRAWIQERARGRGVDGWAANARDGSVELWLQGEPEAVSEVERAAAEGPRHADVDGVEGSDATPRDDVRGFERR